MKKKPFFLVIVVCVCLFAAVFVGVSVSERFDVHNQTGEPFKEATEQDNVGAAESDGSLLLAEFRGEKVYQADVEYYHKMNQLFSADDGDTQTTQEILTEILQNVVLFHEAQRLGYAATQEEIDAMVENAALSYSIPEGKEMIEQYCEAANITVDEYFAYLEAQAPRVIARQKLLNAVGKEFCEEHGLAFTKVNPPKEMVAAREAYIAQLFSQAEDEIIYYTDAG